MTGKEIAKAVLFGIVFAVLGVGAFYVLATLCMILVKINHWAWQ